MRRMFMWACLSGVIVFGAGCVVESVSPPLPTGPSELATSLVVTVTPDVLRQDGVSTATIGLHARDALGLPVAGLSVRLDVLVDGIDVDFGTLTSRTVTTGMDGSAVSTYQAPAAPPPSAQSDTTVTIRATLVGGNHQQALPRSATLRLVRPDVFPTP
ncbi:MAG: hypothetical protein IT185_04635 [Acidobacteria bacterium]|nr:hypothetical protein [Acidobacteriota bacterium]